MSTHYLGKLCTASFQLPAAVLPSTMRADTDACTMLTASRIASAIGSTVSAGTHVTRTFAKTWMWNASGSSTLKFVTLFLRSAAAYDGGKRMAAEMVAATAGMKPAAVVNDAYYFVAGSRIALLVKKGSASFKVTVYATMPVGQKEAMELTLVKEGLAKL